MKREELGKERYRIRGGIVGFFFKVQDNPYFSVLWVKCKGERLFCYIIALFLNK